MLSISDLRLMLSLAEDYADIHSDDETYAATKFFVVDVLKSELNRRDSLKSGTHQWWDCLNASRKA